MVSLSFDEESGANEPLIPLLSFLNDGCLNPLSFGDENIRWPISGFSLEIGSFAGVCNFTVTLCNKKLTSCKCHLIPLL